MRKRTFVTIVSVLLILIFVTVGRVASQQSEENIHSVVSPTPNISPVVTPTPSTQEIIGEVEGVGQTVDYKNATMIRVDGQSIYVTGTTRITDPSDRDVDKNTLVQGIAVIATGTPVEGGIEADRIIVVTLEDTIVPTNTPLTPTISPGQAEL